MLAGRSGAPRKDNGRGINARVEHCAKYGIHYGASGTELEQEIYVKVSSGLEWLGIYLSITRSWLTEA